MEKKFSPHLALAQNYWKGHLRAGDVAIDATCGNGNDTLFLSGLLTEGLVVALDIQSQAIENTARLLEQHQIRRVLLHQISHAEIGQILFPSPPRLIVYNLGYLPRGDKSITTQTDSTLESVKKSLQIAAVDGAVSITCYPGHDEGEREELALIDFVKMLPADQWSVCHHKWLNRPRSPSFIWIVRQTKEKP